MAKCNRKMCKVCDGSFEMTRGCDLEKRCPACRILYGSQGEYTHKAIKELALTSPELASAYFYERQHGYIVDLFKFISIHDKEVRDVPDMRRMSVERMSEMDELRGAIMEVLSKLNKREQEVIMLRFGFATGRGETLEEIAEDIHASRERVRQIESSAIKKLKHPKVGRGLLPYLSYSSEPKLNISRYAWF